MSARSFGCRLVVSALAALLTLGLTLENRVMPAPFLHMPPHAGGEMPPLLSRTGAFADTARMVPVPGLIAYQLVVSFWSDGAGKQRWISIPKGKIKFSATGEWSFPPGTVFIKTFQMPIDEAHPEKLRRLETRLLVRDADGGVYGVTYKWRDDNSDADLLRTSRTEPLQIKTLAGDVRQQTWYYPSGADCLQCHTALAGGVLGVKTRQINRDHQLLRWNRLKLFDPAIAENELAGLPALAALDDASRSIEERARSYLDANCSHCHRPGGTVAYFDARYVTPLAQQRLVDGAVLIDQGIDRPRIVSPHDVWRSIAYLRINTDSDIRMPPLARETIDTQGLAVLGQWIVSMPGRDVVAPVVFSMPGGTYDQPIEVSLSDVEGGADIRYTLDGSVPGNSDLQYHQPIKLDAPTVIRARAFKPGYTRSIATQEAFIIGP